MCWTYDKSKGEDTRELQSRMVSPKNWVKSPKRENYTVLNIKGNEEIR